MASGLPTGFALLPESPRLAEYQFLRRDTALPAKTDAQAVGALRGSWAFCSVRDPGGDLAAMGRVVGDGGWIFMLADLATRPGYQIDRLSVWVLEWLLGQIRLRAPADPTVTAVTDPPARDLYEQAGFRVLGRHGSAVHMVLDPS